MKFSKIAEKLKNKTDDEIEEYLGDLQDRGGYEKIVFDAPYDRLFVFDPDDGSVSWDCPEHGFCEADFMDLFFDHSKMLRAFEKTGCGFED